MRLVLDTNVVASALLWGGTPRTLLQAARDKRATLFTSTPLLAELTDILGRSKFVQKIAASALSLDQLVDGYAALASMVRPTPIPRTAPDPDDDAVLATALAASAEAIVSGDRKHLLVLQTFQGIPIISVARAVELIGMNRP